MRYTVLYLEENYPTIEVRNIDVDEIWSIYLADMIDYKIWNNTEFMCIFKFFDISSKYTWAIKLKIKNSQAMTNVFSYTLSISQNPNDLLVE